VEEDEEMEIKICGLTNPKEAEYLNEADVDYAGFVFFEKSKRNVTVEQAQEIFARLKPSIQKVAVTVSPDTALVRQLQNVGFDILQVHKQLTQEVLTETDIPVWYAFNVQKEEELAQQEHWLKELPCLLQNKITALVVDGAEYGSGQTFDWQKSKRLKKAGAQSPPDIFHHRKFILAGGLDSDNVAEGIRIFAPDIVDVSSGVEGPSGKDRQKIRQFVEQARRA
jgi:phosphoribosylanthranilate isomerase